MRILLGLGGDGKGEYCKILEGSVDSGNKKVRLGDTAGGRFSVGKYLSALEDDDGWVGGSTHNLSTPGQTGCEGGKELAAGS